MNERRGGDGVVKEHGDIPEDCKGPLQDDMTFSLDYRKPRKKKEDNDPMWFSASSTPGDWLFADEES
jgi:hypothetical protein